MGTYKLILDIHLTHAATDHLVDALAALEAVDSVTSDDTEVVLTLGAEGATPADALATATNMTLDVIAGETSEPGIVVAAEMITEAEADRRSTKVGFPELVGIAEIADLLEISRQRASALQARTGFPTPVARLRSGPVWLLSDLATFARTWDGTTDHSANQPVQASPPIDVGKLVGTVSNFIPSPFARNAVKLVRWYATRPKD